MFRPSGEIIRLPTEKTLNIKDPSTSYYEYNCNLCDEGGWSSETEVAFHGKVRHRQEFEDLVKCSSIANPVCLICLTQHPTMQNLQRHYNVAHLLSSPNAKRVEREIFICDYDNQIFFNKNLLELHIVHRHMRESNNKLFCPLCFKNLKRSCMHVHFLSHQFQSISCCPICLKKTENRIHLKTHIAKAHRKYLTCNICGYSTNRENLFESHLNTYDNKPLDRITKLDYRRYFLKPRTKGTWRHSMLRYGLKGLDLYNSISICVMCRHICTTKREMKNHIRRDHSDRSVEPVQKYYICVCGELFRNPVLLKHHVFKMKHSDHYEIKCTTPVADAKVEIEDDGAIDIKEDVETQVEIVTEE